VDIRTNGLEHGNRTGYKVQVHEVEPGVVFKDSNITVRAFSVRHGSWDQAFGYRFDTPDRSIVISGDTSPTDEVVKACHGCDLLLHEAYLQARYAAQPPERQKYMRSFHTSTAELGKLATEAKPHLLVLYHYSGSDHEPRVREVKQYFSGDVVSAHDLDVY
ncbi:MAG TPA: MBL fold metallo-hydrolase, partial [Terriglobales bacterium]